MNVWRVLYVVGWLVVDRTVVFEICKKKWKVFSLSIWIRPEKNDFFGEELSVVVAGW